MARPKLIEFDNPLVRSEVPEEPLSIALPTNVPSGLKAFASTTLATIVFLIIVIVLTSLLIDFLGFQKAGSLQVLLTLLAFGALVQRLRNTSNAALIVNLLIFGAFALAVSDGAGLSDPDYLTLLLLGTSFGYEFAISHIGTVRPRLHFEASLTLAERIRVMVGSIVLNSIVVVSDAANYQHVYSSLAGPSVFLVIAFFVLTQLRQIEPMNLLRDGLNAYYGYPNDTDIAPGLLMSSSGSLVNRYVRSMMVVGLLIVGALAYNDLLTDVLYFVFAFSARLLIGFNLMALFVPKAGLNQPSWAEIIESIRSSTNEIEANSLFLGQVAVDSSPVLIHLDLCKEHIHTLGDSGSGKTSRLLAPVIEQFVLHPKHSVIVVDMKADTMELYGALSAAAETIERTTGMHVPIDVFSSEHLRPSLPFNPFLTPGWDRMSIQEQSEVIACVCDLEYGQAYGAGFFSAMNVAAIKEALTIARDQGTPIRCFRDLYFHVASVLRQGGGLLDSVKKAAVHVEEITNRYGRLESMNVSANSGHTTDQLNANIDLSRYFTEQRLAYVHLPATLGGTTAAGCARMFHYFLLLTAKHTPRNQQIVIVTDEFQLMAIENFQTFLQTARSYGISIVLANQSLQDLKARTPTLLNSVEANCHVRQWFSVGSLEDMRRLVQIGGTRTVAEITAGSGPQGEFSSVRHVEEPRLDINTIRAVSDDPNLSIVMLTNDQVGYARYGGLPFVVRTEFHISKTEYLNRKALSWPILAGMVKNEETLLRPHGKNTRPPQHPGAANTPPGRIPFQNFIDPDDEDSEPTISEWNP